MDINNNQKNLPIEISLNEQILQLKEEKQKLILQYKNLEKKHEALYNNFTEITEMYYQSQNDDFIIISNEQQSKKFPNEHNELYSLQVNNNTLINKNKKLTEDMENLKKQNLKLQEYSLQLSKQIDSQNLVIYEKNNEIESLNEKLNNFVGVNQKEIDTKIKFMKLKERRKYQVLYEDLLNKLYLEGEHSKSAWNNFHKEKDKNQKILNTSLLELGKKKNQLEKIINQMYEQKNEMEKELEKLKQRTYQSLSEAFEINQKYKFENKWAEFYLESEQRNRFAQEQIKLQNEKINALENQIQRVIEQQHKEKKIQQSNSINQEQQDILLIKNLPIIKSPENEKKFDFNSIILENLPKNLNDSENREPIFQVRSNEEIQNFEKNLSTSKKQQNLKQFNNYLDDN